LTKIFKYHMTVVEVQSWVGVIRGEREVKD